MKAKLLLAVLLAATLALAGKDPQVFVSGQFEGFTKPYVEPTVKSTGSGYTVTFPDMGAKGTITITKLPSETKIKVVCGANIKLKKCEGCLETIQNSMLGSKISGKGLTINGTLDCSQGYAANVTVTYAKTIWAGENPKGATIAMINQMNGGLKGNVKSLKSDSFNGAKLYCTTPKCLKISAKNGGSVIVGSDLECKAGKGIEVTVKDPVEYYKVDLENNTITEEQSAPDSWSDEDKTKYMWFKRVEAGSFVMGSPDDEKGHNYLEVEHTVTLSEDYYMAIFEMTEGQYVRIMGQSGFRDSKKAKTSISYADLRGSNLGAQWPNGSDVDSNSVIGTLRGKVTAPAGLRFDLPTEAQWECACRAGTGAYKWNDGSEILETQKEDTNLNNLAWYQSNKSSQTAQPVGQKTPNGWGLYDMHGNALEWCLDWYKADISEYDTDPVGPATGTKRMRRGGDWNSWAIYARSAFRNNEDDPSKKAGILVGGRLALIP